MSPRELFEQVSITSPAFSSIRAEHVLDNGELLPHVLVADLLRYVGAYFEPDASPRPATLGEVQAVLEVVDRALRSGNSETVNAVAVSFLEHIETELFYASLEPHLGPALRAELASQRGWYARNVS